MKPSTEARVADLPTMTVSQLRDEYRALFGEPTASRGIVPLALLRLAWWRAASR